MAASLGALEPKLGGDDLHPDGPLEATELQSERPWVLDPEIIRTLLVHIASSDAEELEISWSDGHIRVRRDAVGLSQHPVDRPATSGAEDVVAIRAPLTGVYYSRPSPDQEPFVALDAAIHIGDTVALIETMKVFNDVKAEVDGIVTDILVEDGDLVEEGQPMIQLRPSEGSG